MTWEEGYREANAQLGEKDHVIEVLNEDNRRLFEENARLREENASLVDRHNRKSHGTASHEALAYDAVVQERDRLREERDAWKDSCEEQIALLMKTADQRDILLAAMKEVRPVLERAEMADMTDNDYAALDHAQDTVRTAISKVEGARTPLEVQEDDMCPNCVTPWKCNGPHISEVEGEK